MKQRITFLSYFCHLIVYGECGGDFIVTNNSVFQQSVTVSNVSLIKDLNCNGNVSVGTSEQNSSIIINLKDSLKYSIPYKKKNISILGQVFV